MSESGLVGPGGAPLAGAKAVLGDDQLRAKQAAAEIKTILEAYDAQLFPVMMLSPKGVIGVSVDVIPNTRPSIPMGPELTGQEGQAVPDKAASDGEAIADAKSDVDPVPADVIALEKEEGMEADAALDKALTDEVAPDEGA
jgi:hypothetical protein